MAEYLTITVFTRSHDNNTLTDISGVPIYSNGRKLGNTGSGGKLVLNLLAGSEYVISCKAPEGYDCVTCSETVFLENFNRVVDFVLTGESVGTCNMSVRTSDQDNRWVYATVRMKNKKTGDAYTKTINEDKGVVFELIQGDPYEVRCSKDGCTTAVEEFTALDWSYDTMTVDMMCEVIPVKAYVTAYVKEVDADVMEGVDVTLVVTGGKTETKQTAANGAVTFEIFHGDLYTITAAPPAEYTCDCEFCMCSATETGDSAHDRDFPFRMMKTADVEPEEGEQAIFTDVRHLLKLHKGDQVSVDCDIKNTGTETCELVLRLYDGGGTLVDENPNSFYFKLDAGKSITKNVSTASHPLHSMPDHDIEWLVELDEIKKNDVLRTVQNTYESKKIPIALDLSYAEGGKFVNVVAPGEAHKGDEVSVTCIIKNTGTKTSEYRVYLKNPEGRTIDKEPDTLGKSCNHGEEVEIIVSTHWDPEWAMPGYDWNLKVELWELDLNLDHDLLDSASFTVKYVPEDDSIIETDLLIDVPSLVMAGIIEVSGTGPANERVYIMGEKSWLGFDYLATDTELADTIIDADGTYSTEVELDEFGSVQIYAKVKKGGFWDWIVADLYSKKHTVWVLTWTVALSLALGTALILEKKYNKLGIFRR